MKFMASNIAMCTSASALSAYAGWTSPDFTTLNAVAFQSAITSPWALAQGRRLAATSKVLSSLVMAGPLSDGSGKDIGRAPTRAIR